VAPTAYLYLPPFPTVLDTDRHLPSYLHLLTSVTPTTPNIHQALLPGGSVAFFAATSLLTLYHMHCFYRALRTAPRWPAGVAPAHDRRALHSAAALERTGTVGTVCATRRLRVPDLRFYRPAPAPHQVPFHYHTGDTVLNHQRMRLVHGTVTGSSQAFAG